MTVKIPRRKTGTKTREYKNILLEIRFATTSDHRRRSKPLCACAASNVSVASSTRRTLRLAMATRLSTLCVKQLGRAGCSFQSNSHTRPIRSAQQKCANEPHAEIAARRYSVAMFVVLFPPDAPAAQQAEQKRLRTHQISDSGDVQNLQRHKPGEWFNSNSRERNQRLCSQITCMQEYP